MKFSITIPAYKSTYLKEAIQSVLKQTYSDFELIIVDDCSPEDLKTIINQFPDRRLKYFRNEKNCGAIDVVDNWNICLEKCSGEYVICIGDDDRLLPNCLEEYYKLIEKYPGLNVYHAWTEQIDENGEPCRLLEPRPETESALALLYYRWKGRFQYIGDFCYLTQHLRQNGGYYKLPLAWGSDDITAFRAAIKDGIANTQKPTFQYRISRQTISTSTNHTDLKMEGFIGEKSYVESVLNSIDVNNLCLTDKWYYNAILREKDRSYYKRMSKEIELDVRHSFFNYFTWLHRCSKFGIPRKYVAIIIFKNLKCLFSCI